MFLHNDVKSVDHVFYFALPGKGYAIGKIWVVNCKNLVDFSDILHNDIGP